MKINRPVATTFPPAKCTVNFDIFCNPRYSSNKDEYSCKVYPRGSEKLCGGAILDGRSGTIKFYGKR